LGLLIKLQGVCDERWEKERRLGEERRGRRRGRQKRESESRKGERVRRENEPKESVITLLIFFQASILSSQLSSSIRSTDFCTTTDQREHPRK
jgi:hypothetical protein